MHMPTYYITFNLFRMELDDYDNLLKVIAVAEAFGELDPPKPIVKYWVHPINHDRTKN